MKNLLSRKTVKCFKKIASSFILVSFVSSLIVAPSGAQILPTIGTPVSATTGLAADGLGTRSDVASSVTFQPPVLLGLKIHPENPLLFDFIVDQGQSKLSTDELKAETTKLVKYFLAALTIPDKEVWVNLSPTEKDRIIPDVLGQTTMGKTMLEQDYILKQLAASLTNPETELGKKYWEQVNRAKTLDARRLTLEKTLDPRRSTLEKNNITTVQPPTTSDFNKVWIMPAKAEVLESNGIVLVGEKRLKVMLDEEYGAQALSSPHALSGDPLPKMDSRFRGNDMKKLSTQIFRELILPKIVEEVNTGKDFADVRQIYNSVILAAWYKKALKESLLGKIYTDKGKVAGVETDDKEMKQRIYEQYLAAFKKGAYNLIKEEADENGDLIPRKYFSGGVELSLDNAQVGASPIDFHNLDLEITKTDPAAIKFQLEGIDLLGLGGFQIQAVEIQLATGPIELQAIGSLAAEQAQPAVMGELNTGTLPQVQELSGARFKEGVLNGSIGVGTKIDSFTSWVSDNKQSISANTTVEIIDTENGRIKFVGYAPMSFDKIISVTLAALNTVTWDTLPPILQEALIRKIQHKIVIRNEHLDRQNATAIAKRAMKRAIEENSSITQNDLHVVEENPRQALPVALRILENLKWPTPKESQSYFNPRGVWARVTTTNLELKKKTIGGKRGTDGHWFRGSTQMQGDFVNAIYILTEGISHKVWVDGNYVKLQKVDNVQEDHRRNFVPEQEAFSDKFEIPQDNDNWIFSPRIIEDLRIPGHPVGITIIQGNTETGTHSFRIKYIKDREREVTVQWLEPAAASSGVFQGEIEEINSVTGSAAVVTVEGREQIERKNSRVVEIAERSLEVVDLIQDSEVLPVHNYDVGGSTFFRQSFDSVKNPQDVMLQAESPKILILGGVLDEVRFFFKKYPHAHITVVNLSRSYLRAIASAFRHQSDDTQVNLHLYYADAQNLLDYKRADGSSVFLANSFDLIAAAGFDETVVADNVPKSFGKIKDIFHRIADTAIHLTRPGGLILHMPIQEGFFSDKGVPIYYSAAVNDGSLQVISPKANMGPRFYRKVQSMNANSGNFFAAKNNFSSPFGGIDFDPTNMNLQIKRDGRGVPLPLPQQNLEQINIQGLFPVIINITPINVQTLPIFLGQAPKEPAREPELAAGSAS